MATEHYPNNHVRIEIHLINGLTGKTTTEQYEKEFVHLQNAASYAIKIITIIKNILTL